MSKDYPDTVTAGGQTYRARATDTRLYLDLVAQNGEPVKGVYHLRSWDLELVEFGRWHFIDPCSPVLAPPTSSIANAVGTGKAGEWLDWQRRRREELAATKATKAQEPRPESERYARQRALQSAFECGTLREVLNAAAELRGGDVGAALMALAKEVGDE